MTRDGRNSTTASRACLALARRTSIGDAFGERFFTLPATLHLLIGERAIPAAPWRYTDDTQMALSIVEILRRHGEIDQNALAKSFSRHYDPTRGYGPAMHRLLPQIRSRISWRKAARALRRPRLIRQRKRHARRPARRLFCRRN